MQDEDTIQTENEMHADLGTRAQALQAALALHSGVPTSAEAILETARQFRAFLYGDEEVPE